MLIGMKMRGFAGIIVAAIGVVVGVILLFSVVQPVLNTAITSTSSNLGGYSTAQVVANQLPTLNAVAALVLIAGLAIGAFAFGRG